MAKPTSWLMGGFARSWARKDEAASKWPLERCQDGSMREAGPRTGRWRGEV